MNTNKFLTSEEDIKAWLKRHKIFDYELTKNSTYGFTVEVKGNVDLSRKNLDFIPVKFSSVKGCLFVYDNDLVSLEFCPETVGEDFYCWNNSITSLTGAPQKIGGVFNCYGNAINSLIGGPIEASQYICYNNEIESLEGVPQTLEGDLVCFGNKLKNLNHCPQEIGGHADFSNNELNTLVGGPVKVGLTFSVSNCKDVTTLRGLALKEVNTFMADNCSLVDLVGGPEIVAKNYRVANNCLTSLKGCPVEIGGTFDFSSNSISELDYFPLKARQIEAKGNNLGGVEDKNNYQPFFLAHKPIKEIREMREKLTQEIEVKEAEPGVNLNYKHRI